MAKNDGNEKYAYLNRLSTEQLEELLRADFESPEHGDTDVIFHILEVIEKREEEHPTGRLPDVDKSWEEFQQYYNIPEGEGLSLYPTEEEETATQPKSVKVVRFRPALKLAGLVAAIVMGIFGLMVTAQAAGIDVFGAIGRWTEETFHFVASPSGAVGEGADATPNPEHLGYYNSLQAALEDCGITENLVPTWYPEGFEASEPTVSSNDLGDKISCLFSNTTEESFTITIKRYKSAGDLDSFTFEKDTTSVEKYTSGQKTFYILCNIDTATAIWAEGTLTETIAGNLSASEIISIIDSIGG